jgi:hypothetical protein
MFEFVVSNWTGIMATVAATLALAHTIVALTPTKADDEMLAKIEGVVGAALSSIKK